jgi:hypothetical protein
MPRRLPLLTAALVALTSVAVGAPASAIDADGRLGHPVPSVVVPKPEPLLAPLGPVARCHLVRVVPIGVTAGAGDQDTLLYRPCDPPVATPPFPPHDGRPPVVIPVEPRR